jgi:GDPmannose 4,6-dehydratase
VANAAARPADDYVIATGAMHSVRDLLEQAFSYAGLDWRKHVDIDPRYYRPAEVDLLLGDASKAKEKLGWQPKTSFKDLIHLMVDADMELAKREAHGKGFKTSKSLQGTTLTGLVEDERMMS